MPYHAIPYYTVYPIRPIVTSQACQECLQGCPLQACQARVRMSLVFTSSSCITDITDVTDITVKYGVEYGDVI